MRVLLFALLTGAVLQSWGQKFPKVVGHLPKLSSELPKPVVCPVLPELFDSEEPIDQVFNGLHEFLRYIWDRHCCGSIAMTWLPDDLRAHCGQPVHIKAKTLAEACCQAAWAWPATWSTWNRGYGWTIVVHRPNRE